MITVQLQAPTLAELAVHLRTMLDELSATPARATPAASVEIVKSEAAPVAAAPVPEPKTEPKQVTKADVANAIRALTNSGGNVSGVLAQFGAARLSELKAEDYAACVAALTGAIA